MRNILARGRKTFFSSLLMVAVLGCILTATSSVLAMTDCTAQTQIPQSECQTLVDLFNFANGKFWTTNTNWNNATPPCSWFGITCLNGHVTRITLPDNNLAEILPPSLVNLTALDGLDLANNQLSGSIPALPPALYFLNLSHNQLNGSIPSLPASLGELALSGNQLSGNIPALPPPLIGLELSDNQLNGSIPALPDSLAWLLLNDNQLSGSVPTLPNTIYLLNLGNNQLSGVLPPSLLLTHLPSIPSSGYLNFCPGNDIGADAASVNTYVETRLPGWSPQNSCNPRLSIASLDVVPPSGGTSVNSAIVTLTKLADVTTLTYQDMTLTNDDSPVALDSGVTVSLFDAATMRYQIDGLASFAIGGGSYRLSVSAAEITDSIGLLGNNASSEMVQLNATDLVVDTLADLDLQACTSAASDCSLRGAINLANAISGTDTITFDAAVFNPGTITLTADLPQVTTTIVIDGDGTIIDGDGAHRPFYITASGNLTLNSLTVQNGYADNGGGIWNSGILMVQNGSTISGNLAVSGGGIWNAGTLTVQNASVISDNSSTLNSCDPSCLGGTGGGIYNEGIATINASTISSNKTYWAGGGIWSSGTLTVDDSSITDNRTISDHATNGGGISNYIGGTLIVQNGSTVSSNTASDGGGIQNEGGTLIVDASSINSNATVNGAGGGINNYAGSGWATTATVRNGSTVSGNSADTGGGIFNSGGSRVLATLTIDASIVSGNTTVYDGGGIFNTVGGATTIQNDSVISGNVAVNEGGGIYNITLPGIYGESILIVDASTVSENQATNGGGIFNDGGTLTLQNGSVISGNSVAPGDCGDFCVSKGGGIRNSGNATIDTSTVNGNLANYGGGIWNSGTLMVQNDSTISDNSATQKSGGILVGGIGGGIWNEGTATINSSTLSENQAGNNGGGIFNESELIVRNSSFTDNSSDLLGGGVSSDGIHDGTTVMGGSVIIESSTFSGNSAVLSGGGIVIASGTATLNSSVISGNTAGQTGGGVENNALLMVNSSTINDNSAGETAGGIDNGRLGVVTIRNGSTVSGNSARTGGGIVNSGGGSGGTLILDASTVSGNTAIYDGGGIFNTMDGTTTIRNGSVISGNTAANDGGGIFNLTFLVLGSESTLVVDSSTVSGNQATNGGGIANQGTLNLLNSTVSGNTAVDDGSGVWNSGTATLLNSTVSGNTVTQPDTSRAGGIYSTGPLNISFSTIAFNTGAVADNVYSSGNSNIRNSLILGNSADSDNFFHNFSAMTDNVSLLSENNPYPFNVLVNGNIIGVNTGIILPLTLNGGTTATHALTDNSIARDSISFANCKDVFGNLIRTDQRGAVRPVASGCDAGAYEATCPAFPAAVVTSDDLIQAINAANCDPANNTIDLQAGITYTLTDINNTVNGFNGLPAILDAATRGKLTINGNGAVIERSSADGTPEFRLFDVESGGDLTLNGVTIHNGRWQIGSGMLTATGSTVRITNSTFSANVATGNTISHIAPLGGGIDNRGTMTIVGSTFSANDVTGTVYPGSGGAISNSGILTLTNNTFSGNTAGNSGGGISNSSVGRLTVTNSTFSGNAAANGGGGISNSATASRVTVNNTIIANSGSGGDCDGIPATSLSHTLIEDGTCGVVNGVNGNLTGDPNLGALTGNGTSWSGTYFDCPGCNSANSYTVLLNSVPGGVNYPPGPLVTASGPKIGPETLTDILFNWEIGQRPLNNSASAEYDDTFAARWIRPVTIAAGTYQFRTVSDDGVRLRISNVAGTNIAADPFKGDGSGYIIDNWTDHASTTNMGLLIVSTPINRTLELEYYENTANAQIELYVTSTFATSPAYYPLLTGSPAINAGDNTLILTGITTDERGANRIQQGFVDMGAYESDFAPDFAVDRTDDLNIAACTTAANDCTLRGAINLANAISGTDTISFAAGVFNPGTITLTANLPTIATNINIIGLGATLVTINGADSYQPFLILSSTTVNLSDITITHGSAEEGGGILNDGMLTVTNSTFDSNYAHVNGGGIRSAGKLTVINSTFSANRAENGSGGAIISHDFPLTVSNSTFSTNSALAGGGVFSSGMSTITNSTFASNWAQYYGGGLYNYSIATITNSTFSGNTAKIDGFNGGGSGIYNESATLTLNNSIVANSTSGADCLDQTVGVTVNYSLIKDGSCGIVNGVNGNLVGDPVWAR